jgi:hypothetical protein
VDGFSGGEQAIVVGAKYFVGKANGAIFGFGDSSAHTQALVVARRIKIAAMSFGDDDVAIVGDFHGFVFNAEGANQFHSADFKPDEIVGVVYNAHLVGFGVTHANAGVVILKH